MRRRTVVIGAGLGGLATAALLAEKGYEVTMLETNDRSGGRARIWEDRGFLFDMGPSWYLMPEAFNRYFGLFGRSSSDMLSLVRLDFQFRVFSGTGDVYDVRDALSANTGLFDRVPLAPGLDDTDEAREAFAGRVLDHFERLTGEKITQHFSLPFLDTLFCH